MRKGEYYESISLTTIDGTCLLYPRSPGEYMVGAEHESWASSDVEKVKVDIGGVERVQCVVRRKATVQGSVVSSRGKPIAGCRVYLQTSECNHADAMTGETTGNTREPYPDFYGRYARQAYNR